MIYGEIRLRPEEIADNIAQNSMGIGEVTQASSDVDNGAKQVEDKSGGLAELANKLDKLVAKFKVWGLTLFHPKGPYTPALFSGFLINRTGSLRVIIYKSRVVIALIVALQA